MKTLKKIIIKTLIVIYVIIAISVTITLLTYNEFNCSEIGDYTLIEISDNQLEPVYNKGDLVLIKKTKLSDINEGDYIFLYRNKSENNYEIRYAEIFKKTESIIEKNSTFALDGGTQISYSEVIGSTKEQKVIPYLGGILRILQSKYGYFFFIIVVTFCALFFEVYKLIKEINFGNNEEKSKEENNNYER